MTTIQLPVKISGTILNDLGFFKQNKTLSAATSGKPFARGITEVILTNNTMAMQIILGTRGGIMY